MWQAELLGIKSVRTALRYRCLRKRLELGRRTNEVFWVASQEWDRIAAELKYDGALARWAVNVKAAFARSTSEAHYRLRVVRVINNFAFETFDVHTEWNFFYLRRIVDVLKYKGMHTWWKDVSQRSTVINTFLSFKIVYVSQIWRSA